jgi:threonine dehydrogenase-like Zn-dependent dehydrogenase
VRGRRVLVAGDGRLGLLCAHVLALAGAEVTVAGHHPARAALLPASVRHLTRLLDDDGQPELPEAAWPLAVEATGQPNVLPRLLRCVEPQGTVILKTTSERYAELDLAPLVVNEQTLLGSRCGRLAPALELLASGRIPVEGFVAARYPLGRATEALDQAARRGTLKVLIDLT